jgi:hypothetical protein
MGKLASQGDGAKGLKIFIYTPKNCVWRTSKWAFHGSGLNGAIVVRAEMVG